MSQFHIRPASRRDQSQIYHLYKKVSKRVGSLARSEEEISEGYIEHFTAKAQTSGLQFVVENKSAGSIIGEIHCYKLEPKVFNHVLSELTIAIDPDFQGMGLGKGLFQALLAKVQEERKDILRVELIARESNQKAIAFYQGLGFQIEGKLVNRIHSVSGGFEADIPMAWMNDRYQQ